MNPTFFSPPSDWRDAKWNADYVAAIDEVDDFVKGQPSRFLLLSARAARPVLTPFSVPVADHTFDIESREDVLSLVRIVKTVKPGLRAVYFDGVLIGKIGRNPYGVGWVASCSRGRLYWSAQDAALALVEEMTP